MLRYSQLHAIRLQPDPTDGSPRTLSSTSGSQTTSSTLSDFMPSSSLRVVRPEEAPPALFSPANLEIGDLSRSEVWWRDQYHAIKARGYKLRPRYHPRWQPSWQRSGKDSGETEDGQHCRPHAAMDATCGGSTAHGKQVLLRKFSPESAPNELLILRMFSSPGLRDDPNNHCVPLLDEINLPQNGYNSKKLLVMPLLRHFNNPRFQTYGEFVAFFTQTCEGLQFMHQRNVAHRNFTADNIMFDPSSMYPNGYHPVRLDKSLDFQGNAKRYTRTERPPRYFFISFGLSRQYPSRNVLDKPRRGSDASASERRNGRLCNPFHADIYDLGNIVRRSFMKKYDGFEFMQELVDAMTSHNPEDRPMIEEVVERFIYISASLTTSKLRAAITLKDDPMPATVLKRARQSVRTLQYIVRRRAAIPLPSP